ncbi:hypothetical protein [Haemophilus haemolyticus]|uniref:hypothetical protein n=1 Tax=Haemophilus haemolyticus TaxID=726 RepID=UPI0010656A43|nr:hypothetical protein [Haemophilus haemolyticus]
MTDKNKLFDTIVSFFRSKLGILTVIGSIFIGLDSFLGSILNFPEHYEKFKNDYLYDHFLSGTWSTSTDYVVDHKELNIPYNQTLFIFDIDVDEKDNSINGEVHSPELCNYNPLTDIFKINSDEPSLYNVFFKRKLNIEYLVDGGYEPFASFSIENLDKKSGVLTLKKLNDISRVLPDFLYLTNKNKPQEKQLSELLEDCMNLRSKLIREVRNHINNEIPK